MRLVTICFPPLFTTTDIMTDGTKAAGCPFAGITTQYSNRKSLAYRINSIKSIVRLILNPKHYFPGISVHKDHDELLRSMEEKEIVDLLIYGDRPKSLAYLFRLIMGLGFYKHGFIFDTGRSEVIQKLKADVVHAQNRRIDAHLHGRMFETLDFDIKPFLLEEINPLGFRVLVQDLVARILREVLDLPVSLDFKQVSPLTYQVQDLHDALHHPTAWINLLLVICGLKETFLPEDSRLLRAQRYIRDFIDAADWPEDSYPADVIRAGNELGIDSRGCLAEMLWGMSYNVANVFVALMWHAFKGKDKTIYTELSTAVAERKGMTDIEFVHDHGSRVNYWVEWALVNYPNIKNTLRVDRNGETFALDLKSINDEHPDLKGARSFAAGRFTCAGEYLARTTMILSLRYFLSPIKAGLGDYELLHVPSGAMTSDYDTLIANLNVQWSDDSVALRRVV